MTTDSHITATASASTDAFRSKIRSSFVVLLSNTHPSYFFGCDYIIYKDQAILFWQLFIVFTIGSPFASGAGTSLLLIAYLKEKKKDRDSYCCSLFSVLLFGFAPAPHSWRWIFITRFLLE
jgi:hypothetical protein